MRNYPVIKFDKFALLSQGAVALPLIISIRLKRMGIVSSWWSYVTLIPGLWSRRFAVFSENRAAFTEDTFGRGDADCSALSNLYPQSTACL